MFAAQLWGQFVQENYGSYLLFLFALGYVIAFAMCEWKYRLSGPSETRWLGFYYVLAPTLIALTISIYSLWIQNVSRFISIDFASLLTVAIPTYFVIATSSSGLGALYSYYLHSKRKKRRAVTVPAFVILSASTAIMAMFVFSGVASIKLEAAPPVVIQGAAQTLRFSNIYDGTIKTKSNYYDISGTNIRLSITAASISTYDFQSAQLKDASSKDYSIQMEQGARTYRATFEEQLPSDLPTTKANRASGSYTGDIEITSRRPKNASISADVRPKFFQPNVMILLSNEVEGSFNVGQTNDAISWSPRVDVHFSEPNLYWGVGVGGMQSLQEVIVRNIFSGVSGGVYIQPDITNAAKMLAPEPPASLSNTELSYGGQLSLKDFASQNSAIIVISDGDIAINNGNRLSTSMFVLYAKDIKRLAASPEIFDASASGYNNGADWNFFVDKFSIDRMMIRGMEATHFIGNAVVAATKYDLSPSFGDVRLDSRLNGLGLAVSMDENGNIQGTMLKGQATVIQVNDQDLWDSWWRGLPSDIKAGLLSGILVYALGRLIYLQGTMDKYVQYLINGSPTTHRKGIKLLLHSGTVIAAEDFHFMKDSMTGADICAVRDYRINRQQMLTREVLNIPFSNIESYSILDTRDTD